MYYQIRTPGKKNSAVVRLDGRAGGPLGECLRGRALGSMDDQRYPSAAAGDFLGGYVDYRNLVG